MNIYSPSTTPPSTIPSHAVPLPDPQAAAKTREVAKAVQSLNQTNAIPDGREFTISIDPTTKNPVVRIVDSSTHEVLEQLPAEYVLKLAEFIATQNAQENSFKQAGT